MWTVGEFWELKISFFRLFIKISAINVDKGDPIGELSGRERNSFLNLQILGNGQVAGT